MKFPLFFLLLIFTFKDRNLVENLTNLAEHLKTSWTLHGAGGLIFPTLPPPSKYSEKLMNLLHYYDIFRVLKSFSHTGTSLTI